VECEGGSEVGGWEWWLVGVQLTATVLHDDLRGMSCMLILINTSTSMSFSKSIFVYASAFASTTATGTGSVALSVCLSVCLSLSPSFFLFISSPPVQINNYRYN